MPHVDVIDPFRWLLEIEQRAQKVLGVTLKKQAHEKVNSGIRFRLAEQHFVMQVQGVDEVLPVSDIARLPGVSAWVMGLANIRGNLVPVLSLSAFFGLETEAVTPRSRMLIVNHSAFKCGIVVDQVFGLQSLTDELEEVSDYPVLDKCQKYVERVLLSNKQYWYVLKLNALMTEPEFQQLELVQAQAETQH